MHSGRWTLKFRRNILPSSSGQKHVSPNCQHSTTVPQNFTVWLVTTRKPYLANGRHFTAASLLKFPLFNSCSNILLRGQKFLVIFGLPPGTFRHEVRNQEIKQVFVWTSVFIILSTSCWHLIFQQLANRTYKIICMVVQSKIWNLCSENLRKLLAKCLARTQKNEWGKNWAVTVATKGAFLDFCVQFFMSEYRNVRYFDTMGF